MCKLEHRDRFEFTDIFIFLNKKRTQSGAGIAHISSYKGAKKTINQARLLVLLTSSVSSPLLIVTFSIKASKTRFTFEFLTIMFQPHLVLGGAFAGNFGEEKFPKLYSVKPQGSTVKTNKSLRGYWVFRKPGKKSKAEMT